VEPERVEELQTSAKGSLLLLPRQAEGQVQGRGRERGVGQKWPEGQVGWEEEGLRRRRRRRRALSTLMLEEERRRERRRR